MRSGHSLAHPIVIDADGDGSSSTSTSVGLTVRSQPVISLPTLTFSARSSVIEISTNIVPISADQRLRVPSTVIVTMRMNKRTGQYHAGDISTFRREVALFADASDLSASTHHARVREVLDALENNSYDIDLFVQGLRYIADHFLTEAVAEEEQRQERQQLLSLVRGAGGIV